MALKNLILVSILAGEISKRDKTLVLSDCAAPTPAQQGPGGAGVTAVSSLVPRFVLKSHTNVIKSTQDV